MKNSFRFSLFGVLLLALLLPAIALAAAKPFKYHTPSPESQPNTYVAKTCILETLNDSGLFKPSVYTSGAFGTADQVHTSLMDGVLQLVEETSANVSQYTSATKVFDLPYLFRDYDELDYFFGIGKYKDNGPHPLAQELINQMEKELGVKVLYMVGDTFRALLMNKDAPTVADAQGFKIRTTGSKSHMDAVAALGFNPTPVPVSELFTALQQKVVDGADLNYAGWAGNHYVDVCKFALQTDHLPVIYVGYMSQDYWDSLSDKEKAAINEGLAKYKDRFRATLDENVDKDLAMLQEKEGLKLHPLSADDAKTLHERANAYWKTTDPAMYELGMKIREALDNRK